MTTALHTTLKRALVIKGREYVVTLTDEALKLTLKGKRNGVEIAWASLVDGEAALAVALRASVGAFDATAAPATPQTTLDRRPKVSPKKRPVKGRRRTRKR